MLSLQRFHNATSQVALLTGATGFLGANLLRDLLTYTAFDVVCLVRSSSEGDSIAKLRDALQRQKLWRAEFADRIHPVSGNLAQPGLGLSDRELFDLAKRVNVIYHNGALTNLVLPYRALRSTNVLGTLELLRLALLAPVQAFHHISSLALLAAVDEGEGREEDFCLRNPVDLTYGYAKTKWMAEQLVYEAAQRGLAVSIYRPGVITGHSRTGICNDRDLFSLMLRACIKVGVAPELRGVLYLTPVDFVSRAILEISTAKGSGGKAFHIKNPASISWELVISTLYCGGYVRRTMPYRDFILHVRAEAEKSSQVEMALMAAVLPDSPPSYYKVPIGHNTVEALTAMPELRCPDDSTELLRLYLSYLASLKISG